MKATIDDLGMLEHLRQTFQRHRIQMGNRIAAVEQERSQVDVTIIRHYAEVFEALEADAAALIADSIKDHPVWPWLEAVKGIGPGLAGALLAPIDIKRAEKVSSLWCYAGQGLRDGQRDRPTKGERLPYNADLKRTCYLIATSFLRANSPYRREYDEAKADYIANRPDWTLGHADMAARRKMIKLFLSHLWTMYRYECKLPVPPPYAFQVLGHSGYKPPWEYVPDYPYDSDLRDLLTPRPWQMREAV